MFDFDYELKVLPEKPGVYIMKNSQDEVIYVGKAKILKNRVRQYFHNSNNHGSKVKAMVDNIRGFEYIITDSEIEALILECNLIKKYRPRYNILLKDDKHYPFIKITLNEDFPRIFLTRKKLKDGGRYFGPYPKVSVVYETLELIKEVFPIRTCRNNIKENTKFLKPCLNYHIKMCMAPCAGYIIKEEYNKIIKNIINLLSGKESTLIKELNIKMREASYNLEFEKAAKFRDNILTIKKITEKQNIILNNFSNEDFINVYIEDSIACIQIFFLRNGKIIDREHFILRNIIFTEVPLIVSNFIKEFYGDSSFIPDTIYVPNIEENDLIEKWISYKKGAKVSIKIPKKGQKKKIIDLVGSNAKNELKKFNLKIKSKEMLNENVLEELKDILHLDFIPTRIEAYDISNIQGTDSVGSMIVFEEGKPKKKDYRRFKIKTVIGSNDYESIREILLRRFNHGIRETKEIKENKIVYSSGKFSNFPDLILIDGGLGQVNISLEVLHNVKINIPVCGMVKDDKHTTRGLVYNNKEIFIKDNTKLINFIKRVQDEAHRFAITYHKSLRKERMLHSILDDIPNIGKVRKEELLKKFGTIENIRNGSFSELISTNSMNEKAVKSIIDFFNKNKGE